MSALSVGLAFVLSVAAQDDFTFVAAGDHFDDPPPGMVDGILAAKPAFVVSTGDLVGGSDPRDFARLKRLLLDPLQRLGAEFWPCLGNHDFPIDRWPELWGPEKGRPYYSFDHGNAHIVVLDCNKAQAPAGRKFPEGSEESHIQRQGSDFEEGSAQHRWLVTDLEKTLKKHVFAFLHHPVLSFGGHDGNPSIQKALGPLFEKHRVGLVFTGHSHGYERFKPVRIDLASGAPRAVVDEKEGVTYVVTASGSARRNLYDIRPSPLHALAKKAPNFVVVRVSGDVVRAETIEPGRREPIDVFEVKSRR